MKMKYLIVIALLFFGMSNVISQENNYEINCEVYLTSLNYLRSYNSEINTDLRQNAIDTIYLAPMRTETDDSTLKLLKMELSWVLGYFNSIDSCIINSSQFFDSDIDELKDNQQYYADNRVDISCFSHLDRLKITTTGFNGINKIVVGFIGILYINDIFAYIKVSVYTPNFPQLFLYLLLEKTEDSEYGWKVILSAEELMYY